MTLGPSTDALRQTLETIRNRDGQSVPEFAARLGISYAMLSAIRRGDRQPGPRTLRAIIRTLPETILIVMEHMQADDGRPRRQAAGTAVDSGEGALTSRPPRRSQ